MEKSNLKKESVNKIRIVKIVSIFLENIEPFQLMQLFSTILGGAITSLTSIKHRFMGQISKGADLGKLSSKYI